MKNVFKILFVYLLVVSCTQTVMVLRNITNEKDGHIQFGKNNLRNFSEPISISDSLIFKWETTTYGSYNNSSVIVYDKYVISHDLSGYIHCFDIANGKELGLLKYSGSIFSTPVIYKTRMFFLVNNIEEKHSTVYYYDLKDGKIISETRLQGSFTNQILINGTAFYAVSDNGVICKINFGGFKEWEFETKLKTISTPAMINDRIIFGSIDGVIAAFDIKRKEIVYKKKVADGFFGGVTIADSVAYACDINGMVLCFRVNDGEIIWKANTKSKIMAMPVYNDKNVYVSNLAGKISCFDRLNGILKWQTSISGASIATPILFNNYIIQPNLDSYLYFINTADGIVHKKKKFAGRMKLSPVLFNNLLILGFDKGNIEAYEVTEVK